ncbi:MAG: hypothetical protein QG669_405 [Patescibacteria group bacterium]|nr:hypothetical protein [Patescibacteria group bacterium]
MPLNVPDENVLSLRKKDDFKIEINITRIRDFLKKNRKLAAPVSILIVVLIIFSVAIKGKASIVNFYPETCLGGWENPSNTEGQPSVASDAQGSDFTRDNAAFLKNRAAQMFCGDFSGEVPEDSVPRKFTVRFSWFVDDGSYDKGEKIINEKLDEGRNVQTQAEENKDADSASSESDENLDDTSGPQTDSSTDGGNTDDSSIPSNEDGTSDLPSGEMPQENDSTNEEPSAPSSPDDSGGESSSSDDSSGSDGGTSESTSDSGSSDGGGGSSDSGGSDSSGGGESSSGGEGAFFEGFFTRVFAQEAESPAPQSEQQSEPTQEEVSEPVKEENTTEETAEILIKETPEALAEAPLEEITEPVEAEVPSEESGVLQTESSSESKNEAESSEENTQSENQDLESNGIVSLDETARDDLFKVMYTLDGTNWEELGVVKRNNWKNVEFDIPFSSVDSWEKLSKVQIAIESLPTIDSFPETYLDSVWVSVEYEGVNPDPLPQPDFLTDKVLNDIRYENVRVIKILKPDGEYQIWYAFVPPSLLATVDSAVGSDEIIKSGDTSLQIIDASTVPEYDPLIGPLPQNTEQLEENTIIENTDSASEETMETKEEVLGESIAEATEIKNIDEVVIKEEIQAEIKVEEKNDTTIEQIEVKEIKPFESVLEFVTGKDSDEKKTPVETDVSEKSQEPEKRDEDSENIVLNEEIIKEEGDPVDLRELNQPEWRWDLVARGVEVHPEIDIAVDNFKLFWITQTGDSFNMFGLDSSGTYSGIYIGLEENIGMMSFNTPSGTTRFARFNRDTKKFIFSDE